MQLPEVRRWQVGLPDGAGPAADDGVVGLRSHELAVARRLGVPGVGFHEVMLGTSAVRPAAEVVVTIPSYRGHRLLPVLSRLVQDRLARRGTIVSWQLTSKQGPDGVRRRLGELGWTLTRRRRGGMIALTGRVPEPADEPAESPIRAYGTSIGGRPVELLADFGVFSPDRVDDGTALLLTRTLELPPTDVVADIGTGNGVLAVGLMVGGHTRRAVGTDVDCVALWLAGLNARRLGLPLELAASADPAAVARTALTVCNVPTHIDAERSRALLAGLVRRATDGRLLAVVHRALERRYAQHLDDAGLLVSTYPGETHTVLDARGRPEGPVTMGAHDRDG